MNEQDAAAAEADLATNRALVERQALDFAAVHKYSRRLNFSAEMHWFFVEAEATLRD